MIVLDVCRALLPCRIFITGERTGQSEVLAENLPGFPDNVRRHPDSGYLVAMSAGRTWKSTLLDNRPYLVRLMINVSTVVNFAYNDTRRGIRKVSLFAKCRYTRSLIICIQVEWTLLWAWEFCRYSRIVVISAVVISEVDCASMLATIGLTGAAEPVRFGQAMAGPTFWPSQNIFR